MFCNKDEIGTLWPKPNGNVQVTREVAKLNPKEITFKTESFKKNAEFWNMATERFQKMQDKKIPKRFSLERGGNKLLVDVTAETDEMSELKVSFKHVFLKIVAISTTSSVKLFLFFQLSIILPKKATNSQSQKALT